MGGIRIYLILLTGILLFQGCEHRRAGNFKEISDGGWVYGEPIVLPCDSGGKDENVVVALRYNEDYPYRKIVLEVELMQDDSITGIDTVSIDLNDSRGKRLGNGFGGSYQIQKNSSLVYPVSECMVRIRHLMSDDTIHGIEMIGVLSSKH